ncbi:Gp37-like protein [Sediminivirga luteola]|nr:hypothetical protein [Sediminivirga luteola]
MRDPTLQTRGPLPYTEARVVMRCNGVHAWEVTVNANSRQWERWRDGWGIVLIEDGVLLSGPAHEITYHADGRSKSRTVTLRGLSEMRHLEGSLVIPDPQSPTGQGAAWTANGPAETVLHRLVREQIGPDAPDFYRVPGLVMEPDRGRGEPVSMSARFTNLLDEVQEQLTAGGLVMDIVQDGRQLVTRFRAPKDLTRRVKLSRVNGGVGEYTLTRTAPTVTEAIAGGQGEGSARVLYRQAVDPGPWGLRTTVFLDRGSSSRSEELQQAVRTALEEGQETASVTFEARSLPHRRFGRDFHLGDRITVDLDHPVTEPVQIAELHWDHTGRTEKLQVGPVADETQLNQASGRLVEWARAASKQLRELQTR